MRLVPSLLCLLVMLNLTASLASADVFQLYESRFRLDSALYPALPDQSFCCNSTFSLPGNWSLAGFDATTGLGTIAVTITGAGSHTVIAGLNLDLMPESNPDFTNEQAAAVGTAGDVLWEIDEAGYTTGDLFANVAGALDNANNLLNPDDVSLALGRTFLLAAGQTATVTFRVGRTAPGSGFYLHQFEPGLDLYFSVSAPVIGGGGIPDVPEPSTWLLLGTMCAWLAVARRLAGKR